MTPSKLKIFRDSDYPDKEHSIIVNFNDFEEKRKSVKRFHFPSKFVLDSQFKTVRIAKYEKVQQQIKRWINFELFHFVEPLK